MNRVKAKPRRRKIWTIVLGLFMVFYLGSYGVISRRAIEGSKDCGMIGLNYPAAWPEHDWNPHMYDAVHLGLFIVYWPANALDHLVLGAPMAYPNTPLRVIDHGALPGRPPSRTITS